MIALVLAAVLVATPAPPTDITRRVTFSSLGAGI